MPEFLPDGQFYNITDLIDDLLVHQKKVGVFPVSDGAWFDIGEWKKYQETQEIFKDRYH
jgi:dTDP-glucose pyrophosphorylase